MFRQLTLTLFFRKLFQIKPFDPCGTIVEIVFLAGLGVESFKLILNDKKVPPRCCDEVRPW